MKFSICFLFIQAFTSLLYLQAQQPFAFTRPSREANVSFPTAGIIESIEIKEGQTVKEGDALARLNRALLKVDLDISKENLGLLEKRFEQLTKLMEENRLSPQEFERARADLAIARLEQKRIETFLEERVLRAPFDGVISKIHLELAEQASPGSTPVCTVVSLNPLYVEFFLPVEQASSLEVGQHLTLQAERIGDLEATLLLIDPVIDPASQTRRVRLSIANPDHEVASGIRCTLELDE